MRTEEALQRERDNLVNIFEAMEDGVYIVNQQYDTQYVNPVLVKDFGPYQGRKCYEYLHDREEVCPWCKNQDVFAGETVRWEWYFFKNERTYDLIDTPLTNPDGSISKLGIFRDITERKRAEEALKEYSERLEEMVEERTQELREAQEQLIRREKLAVLGQLAGGVGHELRNPLSVISSSAYYLKGKLGDADEKVVKHLERLERQSNVANKIITDLLDFSRLKHPALSPISVNAVLEESLAQTPSPGNVTVTAELEEGLPQIMADADQVQQVFTNVITNAYQAMTSASSVEPTEGGQLTVRTRAAGEFVEIVFADTGCGIAAEARPHIFEPLFTTRAQGIGLGLTICQRIVEGHRGAIEVESQEGAGSTFMVRLPTHPMQTTKGETP